VSCFFIGTATSRNYRDTPHAHFSILKTLKCLVFLLARLPPEIIGIRHMRIFQC